MCCPGSEQVGGVGAWRVDEAWTWSSVCTDHNRRTCAGYHQRDGTSQGIVQCAIAMASVMLSVCLSVCLCGVGCKMPIWIQAMTRGKGMEKKRGKRLKRGRRRGLGGRFPWYQRRFVLLERF